jgi:F-type H+-transporting ATPase subunit epsilon
MAKEPLRVTIASVSQTHFDDFAQSLTVPGSDGEMTVLANHEALISTLKEGSIIVRTKQGEETYPVERGIIEISANRAVVLV